MGKIRRHEDWPLALERAIQSVRGKAFETGRHDCALFAADCVAAMTGIDFAAPLRGQYDTPEGAAACIAAMGADSLEDLVTAFLGLSLPARYASRGDVASFDAPGGVAIGIIDNSGLHIAAVSEKGLLFLRASKALKIWKV